MSHSKCPIPTGVALTALDPVFRERPHEYLDRLRSEEPVHQDHEFDMAFVTLAEDVGSIMNDRTLGTDPSKSRPGSFSRALLGEKERSRLLMLHTDDPDHKRVRALITKAFNQSAVDAMRPRIDQIANQLLAQITNPSSFDVIQAYAKPLPAIVIAEMLGVEQADQSEFKRLSDTQVHGFNPLRTEEQEAILIGGKKALKGYLAHLVSSRRKNRKTDLISNLIDAEEEGEKLSESEIIELCQVLLIAGNLTTTDLIGNGVLALLQHPHELAKLLIHPELTRNAIEEILRYDTPVAIGARVVQEARQLRGITIEAGQSVVTSLLAANYDPSVHPEPNKFDIERANTRHYSFGGGAHFCLGAPLARAEAQIAIPLLFRKFPSLRLLPGFAPVRKALPTFNGLESLRVRTD